MTALDQTAPLSAEQRDELIKLHEYDELIFGGFICLHCTPDDCDDPDDNVYWPCPPLHEAGVTDHEAVALIKAHRAGIEQKAAVQRVRELLAEADRLKAEYAKAIDTVRHTAEAMVKVGTVMENTVRTAAELGAGAGMDALIGYLSDAGMLPADVLAGLAAADHKMTAADQERADLAVERDALADHLAEIADRLGIPAKPGQKPVVRWVAALEAVTALTATGVS